MTYSIVARDSDTGFFGIAVATRFFASGALVPHITAKAAFATQALINPVWGLEGVQRLSNGEAGEDILTEFRIRDRGEHVRQAHMIDNKGEITAHTGSQCVDWAGHTSAHNVSVAGNMLTGPNVIKETLQCFQDRSDLDFCERLITALEAGEAAGGDKRGRQSAAVKIHRGQGYPWIDLRVDDNANPLTELRRLYAVSQERFLYFTDIMATSDNFTGETDRTKLEINIKFGESERRSKGIISSSQATGSV